MSPSSLCRRGEGQSGVHHHMCTCIHTYTDNMRVYNPPPPLSASRHSHVSLRTSTVTIHRSLSPARPDTSLPARSSFLSVISACFCSSSFCFNFSSYCSFRIRIFSSTYVHTQMNIQSAQTTRNRKCHDPLWMWGFNKYFIDF